MSRRRNLCSREKKEEEMRETEREIPGTSSQLGISHPRKVRHTERKIKSPKANR